MIKNLPTDYPKILASIKQKVHKARYQAFKKVNKELIKLYWSIGEIIFKMQKKEGWGKSTVERLSKDLRLEFPGVRGFSERNLRYMINFYEIYKSKPKLQQLVAEIGWGHNILIMQKFKDNQRREFYLEACKREGWSRLDLEDAIKHKVYEGWSNRQDNFKLNLSKSLVPKTKFLVKDDYNLDFLELLEKHNERQLEDGLVNNIVRFLGEMGGEFSFIGRQYRVVAGDQEFFIDLLFYHRELKCLVAIELKAEEFKPEHIGKLGFYLAALDDQVKKKGENPCIGILICRKKNRTVVEYALRNIKKPIGVATYKFRELPKRISKFLPSEKELKDSLIWDKSKWK